jgi:AraC-like DNA-binding protein
MSKGSPFLFSLPAPQDGVPHLAASLAVAPATFMLSLGMRRLVLYIHENYAEPIKLYDLEGLTGQTIFQIIRAFRRELGTTPHAYLIGVRTDRAAELLMQGRSIAAAAAEAGFSDQSHFARHLKKRYGKTPGAFAIRFATARSGGTRSTGVSSPVRLHRTSAALAARSASG